MGANINPYPANVYGHENIVCLLHLLHLFKCTPGTFYCGSQDYEP